MKYCGCNNCRQNGERNLYQEFEDYLLIKESYEEQDFINILASVFSVQELHDFDLEFAGAHIKSVVERINQYSSNDRSGYRGYWSY